jgi:hypothetical protein
MREDTNAPSSDGRTSRVKGQAISHLIFLGEKDGEWFWRGNSRLCPPRRQWRLREPRGSENAMQH